jgi:uncharacterized lipoprotein NlpE involved in copper resistance
MSLVTLTDAEIAKLVGCAKRVENPAARQRTEGKHLRRDFRVISEDGQHEFILFTRQSTVITSSFSAGLRWKSKSGEEVILIRCNGPDHPHGNSFERQEFSGQAHVHLATERYISAGKKAESFAQVTSTYRTFSGALHELMRLAHVSGLETKPDESDLFGSDERAGT